VIALVPGPAAAPQTGRKTVAKDKKSRVKKKRR
jgi:hypothetical protein